MLVSGLTLARGYNKKAAVTAEKFVPSVFEEARVHRSYKTGDICRYTAHGDIIYVGRADYQVKIRGYRIELGEVESVVRKHQSVLECVAMTKGTGEEKQLITFITITEEKEAEGSYRS